MIINSSQAMTGWDHFLCQILRSLNHVYSTDIFHRNLKHSNLLLNTVHDWGKCASYAQAYRMGRRLSGAPVGVPLVSPMPKKDVANTNCTMKIYGGIQQAMPLSTQTSFSSSLFHRDINSIH
mmetsp:Transcript_42351/g.128471  ORF Transcript_42351/g.128471 Transcript_42351/m.128471 type:complete len:122 (+) Transcript_42351:170-535(+)